MIKKILVKKEFFIAVFVLMLIMQVACMIYFGTIKQGYHIDEVYSYGLSNSYYKPFPTDRNKWLDNSYFNDYLEVGKNDKFKYDSVYYNQGEDVHPPLFYFALHTISSFTPNSFSKWQGIIL
ncbi:MAG: hypothetical protein K0R90_1390, partial [Oscillospiraceae bacterium]|nr:hypothetical protein [Oscillospiraceae bacterium]